MAREWFWMPIYCRVIHRPVRYLLPSWGHWRYAFCQKCMRYRWVIKDRIINTIMGRSIV